MAEGLALCFLDTALTPGSIMTGLFSLTVKYVLYCTSSGFLEESQSYIGTNNSVLS